MLSSYELHLTYLTVRGRGEPILLLLVDSGIPFVLKEIAPETWAQWRTTGKVTRDLYPYSALPVLRVRNKSAGGHEIVLAETSAILAFLEEFLAPQGTPLLNLEVRASAQMIREASLFFLGRVWETSVRKVVYSDSSRDDLSVYMVLTQDWLAPPKREKLWRGLVTRYLRNTEGALSDLNKSTNVIPDTTESLKGYMVAVATAVNFITDLFPSAKMELERQYELCGQVWAAVNKRERIAKYWAMNKVGGKPWTATVYGTAEWIASSRL